MKNILNNKQLLLIARILLSFVFIYAAAFKIVDPDSFGQSIVNYKLIPFSTVNILAIVLPWIEITSGLLLLFGISVKENSFILTALLIIFTFAIAISLVRGLNIECGCFGTKAGSKIGIQKIFENAGLIILGSWLIFKDSTNFTLTSSKT
jgi:uncharacterized membrane protein YphA (DoxX/SURF4 family)